MAEKSENPVLLAVLAVVGFLLPARKRPNASSRGGPPADEADGKKPHAFRSRDDDAVDPDTKPPARGIVAILKRVGSEISDNQLMTQAAAVTFYALLSLFPALTALVAIYGLVADPATIVKQVDALSGVLPGGGQQLLMDELKTLTSTSDKGLTWALILGIGTSLWTSNQAMKAIFNALNAVHEVKEVRGFVKLTLMSLGCTVGVIVFCVLAMACVVVVPAVLGVIGLGFVGDLVNWLRWPLLLVCVMLLLAVLFRFGPCRTKAVWKWISWGSGFAAVAWVAVSILFSWYVANFGSYNKTYGSLGAVIGFMTWIWISATVILVGAQLDAELEKSTVGKQPSRGSGDQKTAVMGAPNPG